jgi:endonuclease-3 related protein
VLEAHLGSASSSQTLYQIYKKLFNHYGPQYWWPGDTQIEVIVGAVLTQNTSWQNVEKAINNLKSRRLLNLRKLVALPISELAKLVRPSGFFNIKAYRLHNLLEFIFNKYQRSLKGMSKVTTRKLRTDLLSVKGIGEETADSILLYAFSRPVFVVDAYTRRIFSRHKFISPNTEYSKIQTFFLNNLPKDIKIYNEFHALIVRLAKEHCKKEPKCLGCPLASF